MPHGNAVSRLEAAVREVERLQQEKKHERDRFVARASSSDPEAHVMRNGEGGTVPSYNLQLLTDTRHGLIVNVEATTDAIDHRQTDAGPGTLRNDAGTQAQTDRGRWRLHQSRLGAGGRRVAEWTFMDRGRTVGGRGNAMRRAGSAEFLASAFPYDAAQD